MATRPVKILFTVLCCFASVCVHAQAAVADDGQPAATAIGESKYRLDPDASRVDVLVYRAGLLARFGHDHVVSVGKLEGSAQVAASTGTARSDLEFFVADLIVDDPDARRAAGFDSKPSAEDRAGTYRNMLRSLEADQFPSIGLRIDSPAIERTTARDLVTVKVELTLHGQTQQFPVNALIEFPADGLRASGEFSIDQKNFGIRPFRALGGALSVRNKLDIQFDLVFRAVP